MDQSKIGTKLLIQDPRQPAQGNFTFMVNIIEKYKTIKCTNPECKYNREKTFETDGLLLYDCFDYHSKTDQRRVALLKVNKGKTIYSSLLYSRNVALEILLGQKPNESSERHCLNGYEYLYHPFNYKTQECNLVKAGKCNSIYCPYYHSQEEQAYFEEYRKVIDQNTNKLPLVEEIQNNLNKINDIVKKNNDLKGESSDTSATEIRSVKEDKLISAFQSNQLKQKNKVNNGISGEYYIYDDTVKFIEDHYHEFKCLKLHLDTVIKYICGFLNSKGGTLYFGINNDGVVKGTDVKEYEIPSFKKKLYEALKSFVPPVGEDEVKVNFASVHKNYKGQGLAVMPNSYVVEIIIKQPIKNELYFTNYKECFVKRSASINQLKTKEIK